MTTRSTATSLALILASQFVPAALDRAAAAERFFCHQCTKFCMPKIPRIRYKCICPKKFCPDCNIENFGYFPACWQRWPFPPNYYCHCIVPPVTLNAAQSPLDTPPAPDKAQELPPPKPAEPDDKKPDDKKPDDKTPNEKTSP